MIVIKSQEENGEVKTFMEMEIPKRKEITESVKKLLDVAANLRSQTREEAANEIYDDIFGICENEIDAAGISTVCFEDEDE